MTRSPQDGSELRCRHKHEPVPRWHESPMTGRSPTLPGRYLALLGLSGAFDSAWLIARPIGGLYLTLKLPVALSFVCTAGRCAPAPTALRHKDAATSDSCIAPGSGISRGCEMYSRGRCVDRISTCSRAARCACSRRLDTLLARRGWTWDRLGPPLSGGKKRCRAGCCF